MISTRRRAFLRLKALSSLPLSHGTLRDSLALARTAGVLVVPEVDRQCALDFAHNDVIVVPLGRDAEKTLASALSGT